MVPFVSVLPDCSTARGRNRPGILSAEIPLRAVSDSCASFPARRERYFARHTFCARPRLSRMPPPSHADARARPLRLSRADARAIHLPRPSDGGGNLEACPSSFLPCSRQRAGEVPAQRAEGAFARACGGGASARQTERESRRPVFSPSRASAAPCRAPSRGLFPSGVCRGAFCLWRCRVRS